jgi:hypothetical protein
MRGFFGSPAGPVDIDARFADECHGGAARHQPPLGDGNRPFGPAASHGDRPPGA